MNERQQKQPDRYRRRETSRRHADTEREGFSHRSESQGRTPRSSGRRQQDSVNDIRRTKSVASQHAPSQREVRQRQQRTSPYKGSQLRGIESSPQQTSLPLRILKGVGKILLTVVMLLGKTLAFLGKLAWSLISKSKIAVGTLAVVVILAAVSLVDFGLHYKKAYPGVFVGSVDVSGMNVEEIEHALEQMYAEKLANGSVTIYANEEAAAQITNATEQAEDAALAQQIAVEEAQANKLAWSTSAKALQASLPTQELAQEALMVGRDNGGVLTRFGAFFTGHIVQIRAQYNQELLDDLLFDVNSTVGEIRQDGNIEIIDGVASATEGHDGSMVDSAEFVSQLDQVILLSDSATGSFVAYPEFAPSRISVEQAQVLADQVNQAIADGARFAVNDQYIEIDASELGNWISTTVEGSGEHFVLKAAIDDLKAKPVLVEHVYPYIANEDLSITFEMIDSEVKVHTGGSGTIPLVSDSVAQLNELLFGSQGKAHALVGSASLGAPVETTIETGTAPETLSFDEAMGYGLITAISSYETAFTTGSGTENRNHNIELVSQNLTNTIVSPGGKWSFNDIAGFCNEEKGFLDAGAIAAGEYTDSVGGGICQVATTIFNSVFDSGLPVITRHEHSLYIASYPEGRDAAVSWPDLDLVWENNTNSDVLLSLFYEEGLITATLYGVDPGYQVDYETTPRTEGEKFSTEVEIDETLNPGTSYIKTRGVDGSSIAVYRTVRDVQGNILLEDTFYSTYSPITEVVVEGPEEESSE